MKNTLFAIGEALIDFIPKEKGCGFSDVTSFSPKVGGAPANVLGAFAKLGGKTQFITQLGNDPFGDKIYEELSAYKIGLNYVKRTDKANTALAFVSLDKGGDRTFSFYRNPSADMLYDGGNLKSSDFEDCYALHFCSVSLGDFPMKEAHKKAISYAKENGAIISLDLNIRLPLWNDEKKLKSAINEFLPLADIVKVSGDELEFLTGCKDIENGAKTMLESSKLILCTCGSKGAYAFSKNLSVFAPPIAVNACDTTGAGDAFCGSFLYNLYRNGITNNEIGKLSGDILKKFLTQSNAYCAKSVCAYGAIESYPDKL